MEQPARLAADIALMRAYVRARYLVDEGKQEDAGAMGIMVLHVRAELVRLRQRELLGLSS